MQFHREIIREKYLAFVKVHLHHQDIKICPNVLTIQNSSILKENVFNYMKTIIMARIINVCMDIQSV